MPGHSLRDWVRSHTDWIVYRCDGKTPAYYGQNGGSNVPLDVSNPAVLSYQLAQVDKLFAKGANGVDSEVSDFQQPLWGVRDLRARRVEVAQLNPLNTNLPRQRADR